MPWAYSFGRLNGLAATGFAAAVRSGNMFLPGNRGRRTLTPQQQVAELAVATKLAQEGELPTWASLEVSEDNLVSHPDGRRWPVQLEQRRVNAVIASCGNEPAAKDVWVAASVTEITA